MAKEPSVTKEQLKQSMQTQGIDAFKNLQGEGFGGATEMLQLAVNTASPVMVYSRTMSLQLQDEITNADGTKVPTTKLVVCPVGYVKDDAGKTEYSLPIGAIFQKTWTEAKMVPGDEFMVGRFPDAIKKGGRGSGKPMQVYGLKVTKRVPREPAPVAGQIAQNASEPAKA